jgi:hypothetical protein
VADRSVVTGWLRAVHVSLSQDPTEHHDLAAKMPQKVAAMKARVLELTPTLFNPDRCHPYKVEKSPTGAEFCSGYFDHQKASEFFGGFPGYVAARPVPLNVATPFIIHVRTGARLVQPSCWLSRPWCCLFLGQAVHATLHATDLMALVQIE